MPIDRNAFATTLELLAPALKAKDPVPVFKHYCFDGTHVHTFNDVIAIRTEFKFPIQGGFLGGVLGSWVRSVKGKEIEIEQRKTAVAFKAGRSTIEMSPLDSDAFLFATPAAKNEIKLKIDLEELIKATDAVVLCANRETSSSWQYGVTLSLSASAKRCELWATTNISTAHAVINYTGVHTGDYAVPPEFWELVSKNKQSLTSLSVTKKWIIADFEGVRIYSRFGIEAKVSNYRKVFTTELHEDVKKKLLPIPKGLPSAVDRVLMVMTEEEKLNITATNDKLILTVEAADGSARTREVLKFPNHENVSVAVGKSKDFLKPLVPKAKGMAVLPGKCLALQGENCNYFVSLVSREVDEDGDE